MEHFDALIQADSNGPHLGGIFYVSPSLNASLFTVSHLVGPCSFQALAAPYVHLPRPPCLAHYGMCDQLLIRKVSINSIIDRKGQFAIRYDQAGGGQPIEGNVIYGE